MVSTLLALALARDGLSTALVYTDATSTTSRMMQRLPLEADGDSGVPGLGPLPGLTSRRLLGGRLSVLSFAHAAGHSDRLQGVLPKLIEEASQIAEIVVVDVPPLLEDVAGAAVVTQVDATVLVVTRGSSAEACRMASVQLRELGVRLLGTVIDEGRRLRLRRTRDQGGSHVHRRSGR
jgi:Mrp family chromosome partitioning ATPase